MPSILRKIFPSQNERFLKKIASYIQDINRFEPAIKHLSNDHFCPSCHQKRVVEFGEWLCIDVLKKVPHRHFVFSLPKILRRYFLYDRKLLADLSRCAGESLKVFLQEAVPENDPIPGAVIAMQTFGDFLVFNPHAHILVTDGCFYGNKGMFRVAPPLELKKLEAIFRHKVLRMLLSKGKIAKEMIAMLSTWRHSGFHVFCGNRISPDDEAAMENLARYIIRASFSQERMRIVGSIEDPSVIRAIPDHLGIWLVRSRPPPKIHNPPIREYADDFYSDPDYSWDQYIQS